MAIQLTSRVETITPALADLYLRYNINNRPLRKNVVQFYASQMKRNQWVLNGEGIIFNEDGLLVDGQHRLQAIIESGISIEILVVRNAPSDCFPTIDSGISRRASDTLYVDKIPNAIHIASIINRYDSLCKGANVICASGRKKDYQSISRSDILSKYHERNEFWQNVTKFATSCYKNMKLISRAEVGAMIAYLVIDKGHSEKIVYSFFKDLFISDIPKSPMLAAFRNKLIKDKVSSSTKMTSTYKQQLFIKVWNNYLNGKEITNIKWSEESEGRKKFL